MVYAMVTVKSGMELMAALLYSPGFTKKPCEEIKGITRLEKLLYLLEKEGGFKIEDYKFEAYDYGPCAQEIYDDVEALREASLLQAAPLGYEDQLERGDILTHEIQVIDDNAPSTTRTMEVYSLTVDGVKAGQKVFESLTVTEQQNIQKIKEKFNPMSLTELLKYIYTKYPDSTTKSKIRKQILGPTGFGARPQLKPFKREEDDFR